MAYFFLKMVGMLLFFVSPFVLIFFLNQELTENQISKPLSLSPFPTDKG